MAGVSCCHPRVFPTLVGVFLDTMDDGPLERCLPHARGGVSRERNDLLDLSRSSPRSWGCFQQQRRKAAAHFRLPHARGGVSCARGFFPGVGLVFPTLVGVFPCIKTLSHRYLGLPHARGGVSVERGLPALIPFSLPHARGGVSHTSNDGSMTPKSSPRSWGCFCGTTRMA